MIRITKGQQLDLLMSLKDAVGRPSPLTDYDLAAVLKKNTAAGPLLLTFTITDRQNSNGTFRCSANAAVTADLPEGKHTAIVRITRSSDDALIGDNTFEITVKRGNSLA